MSYYPPPPQNIVVNQKVKVRGGCGCISAVVALLLLIVGLILIGGWLGSRGTQPTSSPSTTRVTR